MELFGWMAKSAPGLRTGKASIQTEPSTLNFARKTNPTPGIILGIPAGKNNTVRISYFEVRRAGATTATQNLAVFSTGYAPGDILSTHYKLRNVRASLDFLSYPFPTGAHKYRLKTLWEVQYTSVNSTVNAPFKTVATDSSGTPISNSGTGTNWFVYPSFGMEFEHLVSKHFHWEASGSGFGIPHRAAIWDAEASAVFTIGKVDALVGVKAFHFKTSPKREDYIKGTVSGAYVGLRWCSR